MRRAKLNNPRRARRDATAVIELAVCLPVIVVLVFAAIESCSMIFVTQALHAAAYEGARVAIQRTGGTAATEQMSRQILDGHGVAGATIACEPANVAAVASGVPITVTVSAPCDANRLSPVFFFGARNLEAKVSMVKE